MSCLARSAGSAALWGLDVAHRVVVINPTDEFCPIKAMGNRRRGAERESGIRAPLSRAGRLCSHKGLPPGIRGFYFM